ncbi:MAG: DUF1847 domain-containing protein [Syntrophorhabdaceae bacterium]|nr:DUF1847 domain-containing protein [Syntrophorhabdaceae bacterium]
MRNKSYAQCGSCPYIAKEKLCMNREGKAGKSCPTVTKKDLIEKAQRKYKRDTLEFARQASIQEAECYAGRGERPYVMRATKPRIVEIYEFAKKMGYKRLGLIFCVGLSKEASIVNRILIKQGFEVVSVACKVGCIPKETIGIKEEEKIFIGEQETMCNPILQAEIVNDAETDFNILLGLCVGHDSLFFKYGKAPTTVLAVKDRLTGHNPLGPLYLSENYYAWLK